MPRLRWRSRISFRICACVVTSSAVVGSSAISSRRLERQRHGDHDALALAAGELVRVGAARCVRGRAGRPRAAAPARSRVAPSASAAPCASNISAIWSPIRITGLSAVIGSWKIMRDAGGRAARASRRRRASAGRGLRTGSRPPSADTRVGNRPITACAHIDLPEPDSPTTQSDLARPQIEARRRRRRRRGRRPRAARCVRFLMRDGGRRRSSSASFRAQARVERVVEAFADQVERRAP